MHELSIALSLLEFAEEEARTREEPITAIHLRIGPLSGVVGSALASAYELAREGTALEETELVIEQVPVVVRCRACESEHVAESWPTLNCPGCGSPAPEVIRGRELEVVALEIG
jgi:hydrogenase nickel incorporation protein HypA/HybF